MLFSLKSLKLSLGQCHTANFTLKLKVDKHQSDTKKIASVSIERLRGALDKESIRNLQELGYL